MKVTLCKPREHSGRTVIDVDDEIAPLIQMLNDFGVHTLGSCSGHGEFEGSIIYEQDGETYEIKLPWGGS